jgi:hypothetical protein
LRTTCCLVRGGQRGVVRGDHPIERCERVHDQHVVVRVSRHQDVKAAAVPDRGRQDEVGLGAHLEHAQVHHVHAGVAVGEELASRTALQVAIDADTRLVVVTGDPPPGNRNDCTVYPALTSNSPDGRAVADGGLLRRPEVIIPFRKPVHGVLDAMPLSLSDGLEKFCQLRRLQLFPIGDNTFCIEHVFMD